MHTQVELAIWVSRQDGDDITEGDIDRLAVTAEAYLKPFGGVPFIRGHLAPDLLCLTVASCAGEADPARDKEYIRDAITTSLEEAGMYGEAEVP
jgi:hypothetical protein